MSAIGPSELEPFQAPRAAGIDRWRPSGASQLPHDSRMCDSSHVV
jgi:hypothetical protein